jgi:DMSO reductase anchor subunit
MSKKQWLVLLMLFLTYLLLGASIFYHIESRLEVEKVRLAKEERIEINGEFPRPPVTLVTLVTLAAQHQPSTIQPIQTYRLTRPADAQTSKLFALSLPRFFICDPYASDTSICQS